MAEAIGQVNQISKGETLRKLENSTFDQELLGQLTKPMKNAFNRDDWVDYAVTLKKEGLGNSAVVELIPYSESWVKKYVNPIIREVTREKKETALGIQGVTRQLPKPFNEKRILLKFKVTEIKKSTRTFKGWGTVEVRDSQKEKIGIEGLEKYMPIYLRRGGVVMFSHSNKHVGRLIKYKFKSKAVNGENIPGIWLEGNIFNDYKIDDQAWRAIELSIERDEPVLSLGGTPVSDPTIECDDKECFRQYDDLELYEWTVTDIEHGSKGANPEAKIEVALEKSMDKNTDKIQQYLEKLPETPPKEDLINLMLSKCQACQDDYNGMLERGMSEEIAREELHKQLVKIMDETTEKEKPQAEKEDPVAAPAPAGQPDSMALMKDELGAVMKEILTGQAQIIKLLSKGENPEEEEPEEEEPVPDKEEKATEEAKEGVPQKKEPEIALSKAQFADLAKQLGYQKVSAPAPRVGDRKPDLTKTSDNKKPYPSQEERLEAMRTGTLNALARKYGLG